MIVAHKKSIEDLYEEGWLTKDERQFLQRIVKKDIFDIIRYHHDFGHWFNKDDEKKFRQLLKSKTIYEGTEKSIIKKYGLIVNRVYKRTKKQLVKLQDPEYYEEIKKRKKEHQKFYKGKSGGISRWRSLLPLKCIKCGSKKHLCADHIIPLADGGKDEIENIQVLCKICHLEKTSAENKKRMKNMRKHHVP